MVYGEETTMKPQLLEQDATFLFPAGKEKEPTETPFKEFYCSHSL